MQLTQKEVELLKDLSNQEKLCVDKYTRHADCSKDPQLKNLFSEIAKMERTHLSMITDMQNGTVPPQNNGGGQYAPTFKSTYNMTETPEKQNDCYLCTDLLTAEKHASHLYDTCVFEFDDESARTCLNTIQGQEQNHGKLIYDYMKANSMQA